MKFPELQNIDEFVISPAGNKSAVGSAINGMGLAMTGASLLVANKAFYVPVSVNNPVTVYKLFIVNGATAAGNVDVGIYTLGGTRIVSSGSTAQSGTDVKQEFDIADTPLSPGLYYFAVSGDNGTATVNGWSPTSAIGRALGVLEQASAFPLPATATFAALSSSRLPCVCAATKVTV